MVMLKYYFSAKQQKKMASYCVQIFGDLLLNKELEECPVSSYLYSIGCHKPVWKDTLFQRRWIFFGHM